MSELVDHYGILEVSRLASVEEIRTAFIRRAKETHPDAGGAHEEFLAVKAAYDLLTDPIEREIFDKKLLAAVKLSLKHVKAAENFRNDWNDLSSRADL